MSSLVFCFHLKMKKYLGPEVLAKSFEKKNQILLEVVFLANDLGCFDKL